MSIQDEICQGLQRPARHRLEHDARRIIGLAQGGIIYAAGHEDHRNGDPFTDPEGRPDAPTRHVAVQEHKVGNQFPCHAKRVFTACNGRRQGRVKSLTSFATALASPASVAAMNTRGFPIFYY